MPIKTPQKTKKSSSDDDQCLLDLVSSFRFLKRTNSVLISANKIANVVNILVPEKRLWEQTTLVFPFTTPPGGGGGIFFAFFILLDLIQCLHKKLGFYLAWNCLKSFRWWVVVGGGGGVESKFSVQLWSKPKLCPWTQAFTWTKLNNKTSTQPHLHKEKCVRTALYRLAVVLLRRKGVHMSSCLQFTVHHFGASLNQGKFFSSNANANHKQFSCLVCSVYSSETAYLQDCPLGRVHSPANITTTKT